MANLSFKKSIFAATLTLAVVPGLIGASQAAHAFDYSFGQVHNPLPLIPKVAPFAGINFDRTNKAVSTRMQRKDGLTNAFQPSFSTSIAQFNDGVVSGFNRKPQYSPDFGFRKHLVHNFGGDYWSPPYMLTNDIEQMNQLPAFECQSLARKLELQHPLFSNEQTVLWKHGCDSSYITP